MGRRTGAGQALGMTSTPLPAAPTTDQHTADEPTAAPGAPRRPELRRSSTATVIGGVCGGLADHTGTDPLLWRVGFVGLTVAGGAGILVYLLLWVLVPAGPVRTDQQPSALERLVQRLHTALAATSSAPRRN
jgi:phage shock protein PspC (stress-responsive transcriptional regulator)